MGREMSVYTEEGTVSDETYNGWKNYPTWAVNLWLSNDEGLYNEAREIAEQNRQQQTPDNPHWGRAVCADQFKEWVTNDLAPNLGASFAADLLGYALDQVDWFEIADAWLEQ